MRGILACHVCVCVGGDHTLWAEILAPEKTPLGFCTSKSHEIQWKVTGPTPPPRCPLTLQGPLGAGHLETFGDICVSGILTPPFLPLLLKAKWHKCFPVSSRRGAITGGLNGFLRGNGMEMTLKAPGPAQGIVNNTPLSNCIRYTFVMQQEKTQEQVFNPCPLSPSHWRPPHPLQELQGRKTRRAVPATLQEPLEKRTTSPTHTHRSSLQASLRRSSPFTRSLIDFVQRIKALAPKAAPGQALCLMCLSYYKPLPHTPPPPRFVSSSCH